MKVKEAALKLDVSEQTILNYISSGKLKASKKRRGLRFSYEISETDLQEFVNKYFKE